MSIQEEHIKSPDGVDGVRWNIDDMTRKGTVAATPQWAQNILDHHNPRNRPIKSKLITQLCAAIKKGQWMRNGDHIRFDSNGDLLDGQHRLMAIVRTGVTLHLDVITGLDPESIHTVDTGGKRTGGDSFAILGIPNANRLSAALDLVSRYSPNGVLVPNDFSNAERAELIKKHPGLAAKLVKGDWHKKMLTPRIADACNYLFSQKDPELAKQFISQVVFGIGVEEGSPSHTLRKRLLLNSDSVSRLHGDMIFALCIKTWNAMRKGTAIGQLRFYRETESFPVIE